MKRLIVGALMMLAATLAVAKTFAEAIEEAMARQVTCFVNSEVKRITELVAWQTARIAELERQLAEKK